MRLFFAFDVPEAENLRVQEAVNGLEPELPSARWVPLENRHVTVRFVGSVEEAALEGLNVAARRAAGAVAGGRISLGGLGAFPRPSRARVLWAGVEDHDGAAAALFEALDRDLAALGLPGEDRGYTPHLTLARMKVPTPLPDGVASILEPGPVFELNRLLLMESKLSPKGARYEVRDSFPLV